MQRPLSSPKANPIGSTHSLAEIGALSSANVPNSGSSSIFTRPVASVPQPVSNIVAGSINPPVSHGPIAMPKATPVGVSTRIKGTLGVPLGRAATPIIKPTNYSSREEE